MKMKKVMIRVLKSPDPALSRGEVEARERPDMNCVEVPRPGYLGATWSFRADQLGSTWEYVNAEDKSASPWEQVKAKAPEVITVLVGGSGIIVNDEALYRELMRLAISPMEGASAPTKLQAGLYTFLHEARAGK